MSDRGDRLEKRLQQHRNSKDRTSLLEARVQEHRSARASQVERHKRLEKSYEGGKNRLYWNFVEETPTAATRWDDIGALELLVEKKVEPAIAFSTGVLSVDINLGGGIPAGFTEIYGEESSGKTTFIAEMIQSAQGRGLQTALCASEFLDLPYLKRLGIDLGNLLLIRGRGEDVFVEASRFMSGGRKRAVFIDSATGFRPNEDIMDNWRRMLGSWLVATHPLVAVDSAVVVANQVRARVSAHPNKMFAGGTDSTAAKIAGMFDCRIALSRSSVTESAYDLVVDIVSNTLRRPAQIFTVPVVKGKGVDVWRDLVRVAAQLGVLEQHGSWYYYEETTVAQGEEAVAQLFEKNPEVGNIILEDTLRLLRGEGA
jgi:recombination protein RecA